MKTNVSGNNNNAFKAIFRHEKFEAHWCVSEAQAEMGLYCVRYTLKFNFFVQDLLNCIESEILFYILSRWSQT